MVSDPDIEEFDGCVENLAGAMRAEFAGLLHDVVGEHRRDVIVTLRCWPPVA